MLIGYNIKKELNQIYSIFILTMMLFGSWEDTQMGEISFKHDIYGCLLFMLPQ